MLLVCNVNRRQPWYLHFELENSKNNYTMAAGTRNDKTPQRLDQFIFLLNTLIALTKSSSNHQAAVGRELVEFRFL